jgi:hypothetical protein
MQQNLGCVGQLLHNPGRSFARTTFTAPSKLPKWAQLVLGAYHQTFPMFPNILEAVVNKDVQVRSP